MTTEWIAAIAVPAIIAWVFIRWARGAPFAARLADRPNERSLHDVPRPRVGGIGVMLGALSIGAWLANDALRGLLACAALLFAVSIADDIRSLPALPRLGAHVTASAAAVYVVGASSGWPIAALLAGVLAIAWMTNLFNFMDGSDGLAGGMALIGFAAYALAAEEAGATSLALCSAAIASASAGFLAWNFPPARLFLGDAGSIPLGFLAGALGLYGAVLAAWPVWFPPMIFAPFVIDATVTFLRRVLRREPFWRAHRGHYYQRLILAGWSHRKLAVFGYAAMAAGAAAAFLALGSGRMLQCGIIVVWAACWLALLLAIERYLRHADTRLPEAPGRSNG